MACFDSGIDSKMPLFLSLRTERHGKHRPFMATYTPSPRVCTNARAVPRARYIGVIFMRGMRWLLLVARAAILGGVVYQYRANKKLLARDAPVSSAPLSTDLKSSAEHWQYRDTDLKTGRIRSDIDAESMQQVKDASRVDLKNVAMKIYGKDGKTYDLVK